MFVGRRDLWKWCCKKIKKIMKSHNGLGFPIIKNVLSTTIADNIKPVKPITTEEAAAGRPIKPYPFKYDSFDSLESLKNYIIDTLYDKKNISKEWLDVEKSYTLPFNMKDYVFYTGVDILSITCYEPRKNMFNDIVRGELICQLNPKKDWNIEDLKNIIKEIKNESTI